MDIPPIRQRALTPATSRPASTLTLRIDSFLSRPGMRAKIIAFLKDKIRNGWRVKMSGFGTADDADIREFDALFKQLSSSLNFDTQVYAHFVFKRLVEEARAELAIKDGVIAIDPKKGKLVVADGAEDRYAIISFAPPQESEEPAAPTPNRSISLRRSPPPPLSTDEVAARRRVVVDWFLEDPTRLSVSTEIISRTNSRVFGIIYDGRVFTGGIFEAREAARQEMRQRA